VPLAAHALQRLQAQKHAPITRAAINANRHLVDYATFDVPVWPDTQADFPGPLAGFQAALQNASTPLVLTVPCDSPHFPLDLAQRLVDALTRENADIALAAGPDPDGVLRPQPVFCLMRASLADDLAGFVAGGGRKVGAWTARHACTVVPFDRPGDDPLAFANANTPVELQALEQR
jgi:molybdopterin-guanine dinucleotide biosynthesis protein A